jgi:hypothetical protein
MEGQSRQAVRKEALQGRQAVRVGKSSRHTGREGLAGWPAGRQSRASRAGQAVRQAFRAELAG